MDHEAWLRKSETLLTDVKEWRKAHPKATFVESEDEVHRRIMQLEAHLLRDAAEESSSREWGKETDGERPSCPNCQVPLQARGKHSRSLQGNGAKLSRSLGPMEPVPSAARVFSPWMRNWPYLPVRLLLGNRAISRSWGVGCPFAARVESLKTSLGFT
jgi:hypothetical protein